MYDESRRGSAPTLTSTSTTTTTPQPETLVDLAALAPRIAEAGKDLQAWRQVLAVARSSLHGPCKHLLQLYSRATESIDLEVCRKLPEYAQLWTEYARLQR